MSPIRKCDLLSPFITEKKMITRKKNITLLKIKEKQKPNECFIYPMAYYAKIFQPILTYANDANRIQPRLRNGKKPNNYPMHVSRSRGVRCRRRRHMGALPLSAKVK